MLKNDFINKYNLVEIKETDGFIIDMVYATDNNFTKKKIYQTQMCLLRESTANKLKSANEELKKYGFKIKIWDAYRSIKYQEMLWKICPDERFVSNPYKNDCNHCKGSAVDVTLCKLDNTDVKMPTEFDHFGIESYRNYYPNLDEETKNNVLLLENIMIKHGFGTNQYEWWHFNDCDDYEIIRESFDL